MTLTTNNHQLTTLLPAAKLLNAHGLKGAIKAKIMLEHPEFMVGHTLSTSREGLTLTVTKVQAASSGRGRDNAILHLKESTTRESAEALGGVMVYLPKELVPPPPEGEVYLRDLVGKPVLKPDGTPAGTVKSIMDNPAHPILELETGQLVPAHPEFIGDLAASHLVLTETGLSVWEI